MHWGSEANATALMVGAYRTSARRHERLLHSLPPVLVVTDDFDTCGWIESAAASAVDQSAGSQAMVDRLLDWSLVCTLRTWFDQAGPAAPGWFRGLSDPFGFSAAFKRHRGQSPTAFRATAA
ncbi:cupin domain-containing protein [Nocardia sp. NPDC004711]